MKNCILSCFLFFFIVSCNSLNWVTINVQKPAQITLPSSVQHVVIVNNSAIQPADIGHENLVYSKEQVVEVSSDSLNAILIQALAQFMSEENFFKSVVPYNEPLRVDANFLSEEVIKQKKIKEILDSSKADAIISLDRLILKSTLRKENIGNALMSEFLCVNIDANFRFYLPNDKQTFPVINFTDSICWEGFSQNGLYYLDEFPSRRDALRYSTLYTANKMVSMFSPFWQEQDRWYYTSSSGKMKKAATMATNNKWKDAAFVWAGLYESESKARNKAKLASNIALANEMLDDLENAITWVNIALNLFTPNRSGFENKEIVNTTLYKDRLEQRLLEFKKLDLQEGKPNFEIQEE